MYKRPISHLSKGYRQRVGIAQALISSPDILVFDEPTVGLDPRQIIEIRDLITSLGKNHTVILSTHILSEVKAVCDRVVIINKGKLVADAKTEELEAVTGARKMKAKICGPKDEVLSALKSLTGVVGAEALPEYDADAVSYMIESQPDCDIRKSLFNMLSNKGWPLVGLENFSANLEDVFIDIVGTKKEEQN